MFFSEIAKELEIENAKQIYYNAIREFKQSNQNLSVFNNYLKVVNLDYCQENFHKICRFCLSIQEDLTEIDFSSPQVDILDLFNKDASDQKMFNQICVDCRNRISKFYEFKKQCQENFKLLTEVKEIIKEPESLAKESINEESQVNNGINRPQGTMCQVCGKLVKGLHMHMLIHKGIKRFHCEYCTKSFTQSGQLKRHVNSHLNIRNYSCPHPGCSRTFVDPSSVSKHLVIHNKEERPFVCTACAASFNRLGALRYHEKTHRQERNHKCDACNKAFLAKYDLTKHYRTHSGEKPFGCNFCEKRFSISKNAKVHQRVHTKERPFCCNICDLAFSYRSSLKQHEKRIHRDETKDQINVTEGSSDVPR